MHATGLDQPNKIWRVLGSQTAIRASSLPIHSRAGGSRCIRASPYRVSPPDASSRKSSVAWPAARSRKGPPTFWHQGDVGGPFRPTPHAPRVEHYLGESSGSAVDAARRAEYQWPEKLGPRLVEISKKTA